MENQIITSYVLCDELLKQLGYRDDSQCHMSTAEVLTTALVADFFFGLNFEAARVFLHEQGYIPDMLSKSQFNRRLHAIPEEIWQWLVSLLFQAARALDPTISFSLDSFPVAACDNIRIKHCRLYHDEIFRGKFSSKRRYIYGLRIHLVLASTGQPVDFCLAPASEHDAKVLKRLHLEDLPPGSDVYGDSGYTAYDYEDLLNDTEHVRFRPLRKRNSRRTFPAYVEFVQKKIRQGVEVAGSLMQRRRPAHLHAVTARGFELKVALCVVGLAFWNFQQYLTT